MGPIYEEFIGKRFLPTMDTTEAQHIDMQAIVHRMVIVRCYDISKGPFRDEIGDLNYYNEKVIAVLLRSILKMYETE